MSVRSIHRERDGSIRLRVNELRNGGEKILGSGEGRVKSRRPRERLPRPFKSIREGGKDSCFTPKKLPVEIDHPKKPLKSRLIRQLGKGGNGGGMLRQQRTTCGIEKMAKKLNLGDSKLTFGSPIVRQCF